VRLHLIADVPLGVFLSGGVDSSALVALASRLGHGPLTSLSVAFDEPAYDESGFARLVAERFRTDHREVRIGERQFAEALPDYLSAMDEPTADGMNTYLVAGAARRAGLTVVLSGAGADEVFLGYPHLRRARSLDRLRSWLGACPAVPRQAALRLVAGAATAAGRGGVERIAYLEDPSPIGLYAAVRGLYGPREVQALLGIGPGELEAHGPLLTDGTAARGPAAFRALEFTHYLQDQLLKDADVMSMAHSVEARLPYLDHRLVEHVLALPERTRLAGDGPKPLLLRALGGALPREVWDRPKMGFTLPFASWMRRRAGELRELSLEGSLLDRAAVVDVWAAFAAGRAHWSRPWALVALGGWLAAREKVAA